MPAGADIFPVRALQAQADVNVVKTSMQVAAAQPYLAHGTVIRTFRPAVVTFNCSDWLVHSMGNMPMLRLCYLAAKCLFCCVFNDLQCTDSLSARAGVHF